ncbi:Gfo/Idh/MocA family oxidoreductase [Psychromonas sp. SA13A]|uniref:Gfo/Idh/MocA family protein n=1 Tax=Psychromonas sp. SA13A TaxID=2686346 RepID=UPI0014074BAC|nr:Gfo/Idh/MocA family oxidoreductase [Psychromonas sp. SA13A]
MKRLKLGMVGGGTGAFIGAVHRIAARIDDRFELVAGALSSNPETAKQSAKELNIKEDRAYTSYTQMVEQESQREDGINAVAIVTPNFLHYPIAKSFLAAGINVICDKPMTCTLEEALSLQEIAQQSGCIFVLTHNYSAYPLVRQAKQLVTDGALGPLRLVQVEYVQDWLSTATELEGNKQAEWRSDPKRNGPGGCLGDIATHAFNLASFISGLKLNQVSADLNTFVEGRKLDDNVNAMLRFEKNVKGMLWSSQVAPGNENGLRIRIYGEKAGIEWAQENPNQLLFSPLGGAKQIITRAGATYTGAPHLVRTPGGHPEGYLEGFANIYYEAADLILAQLAGENTMQLQQASLLPGTQEGVEGLRFIEAVIASSEQDGKWIAMEPVHE